MISDFQIHHSYNVVLSQAKVTSAGTVTAKVTNTNSVAITPAGIEVVTCVIVPFP